MAMMMGKMMTIHGVSICYEQWSISLSLVRNWNYREPQRVYTQVLPEACTILFTCSESSGLASYM
jgi:hypothetical protein